MTLTDVHKMVGKTWLDIKYEFMNKLHPDTFAARQKEYGRIFDKCAATNKGVKNG